MKESLQSIFDRISLVGKRFRRQSDEISRMRLELEQLSKTVLKLTEVNSSAISWSKREHVEALVAASTRLNLGHLLNQVGLEGEGAEVGVRQGEFSHVLLSTWNGKKLYSIDPWMHWEDPAYDSKLDPANAEMAQQEARYRETIERLAQFGDRSTIMRATSVDACNAFADGQLDFVYVDAQHHYEAVREDIALWWPKIRLGGALVGDDYSSGWPGVIKAVDEFSNEIGQEKLKLGRNNWMFFKE